MALNLQRALPFAQICSKTCLSSKVSLSPGSSANVPVMPCPSWKPSLPLNQEASAARASTESAFNAKTSENVQNPSQASTDASAEKRVTLEDTADKEKSTPDSVGEGQEAALGLKNLVIPLSSWRNENHTRESTSSVLPNKDAQQESSDQKANQQIKLKRSQTAMKGRKKEREEGKDWKENRSLKKELKMYKE